MLEMDFSACGALIDPG